MIVPIYEDVTGKTLEEIHQEFPVINGIKQKGEISMIEVGQVEVHQ